MKQLHVIAAPGIKFAKQHQVRNYITDKPVEVDATHYYRKAVLDGDLVELTDEQWKAYLAEREAADEQTRKDAEAADEQALRDAEAKAKAEAKAAKVASK